MADASCEDRIHRAFSNTMRDLSEMDLCDIEQLTNYALSFDYVRRGEIGNPVPCFRWQMSWGGPQDEFLFPFHRQVLFVGHWTSDDDGLRYNPNGTQKCQYWFRDWGDSAHVNLCKDHLDILRKVINTYGYHGYVIEEFKKEKGIAPHGEQGEIHIHT